MSRNDVFRPKQTTALDASIGRRARVKRAPWEGPECAPKLPFHRARSSLQRPSLYNRNSLGEWLAGSIRLLFALRYARLARALDDALQLRVEGWIAVPVVVKWTLYPTLDGGAGIVFQHLGCGLLRLLHVSQPGVGGGDVEVRPLSLIAAGDRLVAPFDRLLPLRKMRRSEEH